MLINQLFSLGIHLGSRKQFLQSYYKPFLLGYKNNYCIFDMNKIIFYIQRLFNFFYFLGTFNGKFLFYLHSSSSLYNYLKLFFFKCLNETKNFFFDEQWSYGQLSNTFTSCYLLFHDIFTFKENFRMHNTSFISTHISFINFFYSLLFFTFRKKIPGMEWEVHMKRMQKYWRFFLFFKFYRYLNKLPDLFFFLSTSNFPIPIIEAKNLKIPVISNLDSNFNYFSYVTYPIYGNSENIFIHFFFFILFFNCYKKGLKFNYKFITSKIKKNKRNKLLIHYLIR